MNQDIEPFNEEKPLAFLNANDRLGIRQNILDFKDYLLSIGSNAEGFPVEHFIADGVYTRKLFIPKGSILIGKIHKKECMNIVAKGDITVMTETGCARIQSGYTVQSPPGIMKVGYAHEDTIFINVFRTNETDLEKIENEIACESFDALAISAEIKEALCL